MKRICQICEAGCGLVIDADGRDIIAVSPNNDDIFSRGHACPKGLALKELDADPDRLRTPLIRDGENFREASWEEALDHAQRGLNLVRKQRGASSLATYIGNPTAHNIGLSLGLGRVIGALGSANIFSAGSVDQLPKQLASELMFGNDMAIPVPDIEHSDLIIMLGANPAVSNGSLWLIPKFREHLRKFQERGGRLITIDPRKSETARLADHHVFVKPGEDAYLLSAVINEMLARGMQPPARYVTRGWETLRDALGGVKRSDTAARCGVSEAEIDALVDMICDAASPAFYGRVGSILQARGTLVSFLIEVINILTGSLDKAGGAMFPEQPYTAPSETKQGIEYARYRSRVSGYPEVLGQLPVACLAEEMETEGEGQIRGLVVIAGNPVVSNPDSERLERAIEQLDFMVSVDIYLNETSKLADVILPGTSPFEECHYDSFLGAMGYRNAARFSPALFNSEQPDEWDLSLMLGYAISHEQVPGAAELQAYEDEIVAQTIAAYVNDEASPLHKGDVQEILGMITPERGVERLLDLGIRAGKWGDHFGKTQDGLTLQKLIDEPDGIDLGELQSGRLETLMSLPEINLAPEVIIEDIERLNQKPTDSDFRLIGRRNVNANNSWLHNLPMLTSGKSRCTMEISHDDAERLGILDGDAVNISSATATVEAVAERSDMIAPGVVSLPHGFSQDLAVTSVKRKGPNYNALVAAADVDKISATSALNGVNVSVERLSA